MLPRTYSFSVAKNDWKATGARGCSIRFGWTGRRCRFFAVYLRSWKEVRGRPESHAAVPVLPLSPSIVH